MINFALSHMKTWYARRELESYVEVSKDTRRFLVCEVEGPGIDELAPVPGVVY